MGDKGDGGGKGKRGGKGARCDLGLIWGRAGVIWGHSVVCLPLGDLGTFWEVLRPWAVF